MSTKLRGFIGRVQQDGSLQIQIPNYALQGFVPNDYVFVSLDGDGPRFAKYTPKQPASAVLSWAVLFDPTTNEFELDALRNWSAGGGTKAGPDPFKGKWG